MNRIAVTGASGFIGGHVVAALTARGDEAIPIARPFVRPALAARLAGAHAVVHLAGVVSATQDQEFYRANVDSTRTVAEAARDAGVRIVHISSLAAAGPAPATAPRTESDPPTPINVYGRSKLEGEQVLASLGGLRWTILRPGVVYGARDRALTPLFRYARRGVLPAVGSPGAAYTFIYIDDLVRAILAAIDRGADGDVLFAGHAHPVSPRRLLETIRRVAGSHAAIVTVPRAITRTAAEIGEWAGRLAGKPATLNRRRFAELYSAGFVCRVDRMRERLGVVAETDLDDGLTRSAGWYLRGEFRPSAIS